MYTGRHEFDAYGRNLRRTQLAREIERNTEAMQAAQPELDVLDLLFGGEFGQQRLKTERARAARAAR